MFEVNYKLIVKITSYIWQTKYLIYFATINTLLCCFNQYRIGNLSPLLLFLQVKRSHTQNRSLQLTLEKDTMCFARIHGI